jgi:transposase-like protein
MNCRMSNTLKFWVDAECERRKNQTEGKSKRVLTAKLLHEWEEAGEAMRYLDRQGQIAWKATASMVSRLADAERDAEDELDEWYVMPRAIWG